VVDFCYAAVHLADVINAVSDEHAIAARQLFKHMYGKDSNVEVIGVLNGSGKTWKMDSLNRAEENGERITKEKLYYLREKQKKRPMPT